MAAAFRCRLGEYDASTALEKIGRLISSAAQSGFSTHYNKQTDAWAAELDAIALMTVQLGEWLPQSREWWLLLEYEIPRRDKRPDVVLLADDMIFILEFKIGQVTYLAADEWQAFSYALDLRDFHAGSYCHQVVPVLVASDAPGFRGETYLSGRPSSGFAWPVQKTNVEDLAHCVKAAYELTSHDPTCRIDATAWEHSPYRPTPTIIEAAEQLFAGHTVSDISHAFATNLDRTTAAIVSAIQSAQADKRRTICFVTGTPGAGKTLTGLNAVHNPALRTEGRPPAIFLSGNGPLVKIVREALVRDRRRSGMPKGEASRVVSTFIANVHRFLVHYGIKEVSQSPNENAIIFGAMTKSCGW